MDLFQLLALTVVPGLELRASIPAAMIGGNFTPMLMAFILAVNMIIFFPMWIGLNLFYKFFQDWHVMKRVVESIRNRGHEKVEKYGAIGLAIFVAIPLPMSGVYSGTLLGWLLGMKWYNAFVACAIGVLIAGGIVYALSAGLIAAAASMAASVV